MEAGGNGEECKLRVKLVRKPLTVYMLNLSWVDPS